MKKFIAVFDGLKFSESTFQYATHLTKQNNAYLVGVFLEDFTYHSYSVYNAVAKEGKDFNDLHKLDEKDEARRRKSVTRFEEGCSEAGLNFSVHRDKKIARQELIHESIFADLLIISKDETISRYEEDAPTNFLKEILFDVQCSVLVVPAQYRQINKLVFLYDGSPSSVQAIKMFSYVFEGLKDTAGKVLCVKREDDTLHLPDNKLMKELMKRHYQNMDYVVLAGPAKDTILTTLKAESPSIIVGTGAYKRSGLSMLLNKSLANNLIKEIKAPIFIAE